MKKVFFAILAILYLGSSAGATLHLHYCMGKLVDIGLSHSKNTTCGGCGMKKEDVKKKDCCKDEYKQIKIEKDQKSVEKAVLQMVQAGISTPLSYLSFNALFPDTITTNFPVSNAPPRWHDVPIYLANRNFRI